MYLTPEEHVVMNPEGGIRLAKGLQYTAEGVTSVWILQKQEEPADTQEGPVANAVYITDQTACC
jgi:hypothetical protein